jgi:hypothetical protein
LQRIAQRGLVDAAQRRRVDPQRQQRVGREQAGLERAQAGHREALAARQLEPGRRLAVPPLIAGARVEQHADDDQIDQRLGRHAIAAARLDQLGDAVDAARAEVPEAPVQRDAEVGIVGSRHGDHQIGDRLDAAAVDPEVPQLAEQAGLEHVGRAHPHRERRAQVRHRGAGVGRRARRDEAAAQIVAAHADHLGAVTVTSASCFVFDMGTSLEIEGVGQRRDRVWHAPQRR